MIIARLIDPNHARARELRGLESPEARTARSAEKAAADKLAADKLAADKAASDADLAAYEAKRSKTPFTADARWALALWCEKRGLTPYVKLHLSEVISIDPKRESAWKRLGYVKYQGRWMTEDQVALLADYDRFASHLARGNGLDSSR